ncbi:MAG TPA: hypothetical protein VNF47_02115 [Streptosporangiaceae bacterium]|nr:hypothetical protein [Streptosporangiaceae bacterium]
MPGVLTKPGSVVKPGVFSGPAVIAEASTRTADRTTPATIGSLSADAVRVPADVSPACTGQSPSVL